MSYPSPRDRNRDRKEKGEQPYKDDREAMARQESELQAEAVPSGETQPRESEEERLARLAAEAEARLRAVQDERADSAS